MSQCYTRLESKWVCDILAGEFIILQIIKILKILSDLESGLQDSQDYRMVYLSPIAADMAAMMASVTRRF